MTGKRTLPLALKQILFEQMGRPEIVAIHAGLCMVGTTEEGGNNKGPLVEAFQMTVGDAHGEAWCLSFIQAIIAYVEEMTGAVSPLIATERVSDLWDASELLRLKIPRVGALACWRETASGNGHVGLIVALMPGCFYTIEGNTSSGNVGSQRDGEGVYLRKRYGEPLGSMKFLGFIKVF